MLNKIKCLLWGHIKSDKDTIFTSVYIKEPYGAFYKGQRFVYDGRLYRCKRCGALIHVHGVLSWELEDLIVTTLADLPKNFLDTFDYPNSYDFCRLYRKN